MSAGVTYTLGKIKLKMLTDEHIQNFIDDLSKELAAKSVSSVFSRKKWKFPLDGRAEICYNTRDIYATVAQQVEQLTRNEQVVRSNRISSSRKKHLRKQVLFSMK